VPGTTAATTTADAADTADLAAALGFDRALHRRACERHVPHPLGEAFFHHGLPRAWVLNQLAVDAEVDADQLEAALEQLYAGFGHRRAYVERDDTGARVAPALRERGWLVSREVVMVRRRERDRPAAAGVAREVEAETLHAVEAATTAEEPYGTPDVLPQIIERHRLVARAAGRSRYFVASADGVDAAHATLYSDGTIAQIELVGTLTAFRGRGLARAVVSAALDAAVEGDHALVFMLADDDDWPKELYARLGFDPVGHAWTVTRSTTPST
jgi:GNAT superfamily N-acetyltransferase